ncbi:hypothetical protein KM1_208810 [Entamoeba histolytica HM-3:IMSS]|uniref:VHS domain-containing protein n=4 Tax=Entamoeba histolytica TaxID=5759 RepID=C4M8C3_ENTH1|nr:hypothetical protein EHI_039200 [Entamoeba histolytica HM-1:IMSS]EAL48378.1 hypothetical protein EHI_039200 [Entamoeba histolytica HM-1:IMSS]EMD46846.1 Hypothetical protein EHI5A_156980 [Entamoeba histolytica KU27]EMS14139.1 hypothetical protein KM1_208810 [Entamoeba histolytica HM-3:IMSS]GAT97837.1 hypothetical protein CL6EHI_039200 [Entamoeba histolytica]|eukprot:XP_653765.1 hypothetical protein EHI_039200 [Entamoeba histolytica HM-1:IMSS]
MSNKSIPLSQLIGEAVSDLNPTPAISRFEIISNIIKKIERAGTSLRLQTIIKMKYYLKKQISEKEMYYTFCLVDYVLCNSPSFRRQVTDIDFIAYIEVIGEFKNVKIGNKNLNSVSRKCRELVQEWTFKFPNELEEYVFLYNKYKQRGVFFPELKKEESLSVKTEEIPKKWMEIIQKCKKTEKQIRVTVHKATEVDELIELYKEGTNLNCELMEIQLRLFDKKNQFDSSELDRLNAFINCYQHCLQLLANQINMNQTLKLDTVVSPIDSCTPLIVPTMEDPKEAIADKRIGMVTPRSFKKLTLVKPPECKGLPICQPIHRTISLYSDEFEKQTGISADPFYTTDSLRNDNKDNSQQSQYTDYQTDITGF